MQADNSHNLGKGGKDGKEKKKHQYWVDWVRSTAVMMVIMVHSMWNGMVINNIWSNEKVYDRAE